MYHIIGKYYMVACAYKFTAKFNLETSIKKCMISLQNYSGVDNISKHYCNVEKSRLFNSFIGTKRGDCVRFCWGWAHNRSANFQHISYNYTQMQFCLHFFLVLKKTLYLSLYMLHEKYKHSRQNAFFRQMHNIHCQ